MEHVEGAQRAQAIIDRLRLSERVTVTELAEQVACSEMTIRRDLDQLAEQGVLRRVRGGAVSLLLRGESTPFAVREQEAPELKRRIAGAVDELLTDGESLVLDSGTTTLELARILARRRMTVVPLDLHAAGALGQGSEVDLLLPGGRALPGQLSMTGHLTEGSLRSLRVDTTVLGVCGLSPQDGLTAHNLPEVPVKQAAIAGARRTIAVCDGSKFGRTGLGHVCPITDLDLVVTDESAPEDAVAELQRAGVVTRVV